VRLFRRGALERILARRLATALDQTSAALAAAVDFTGTSASAAAAQIALFGVAAHLALARARSLAAHLARLTTANDVTGAAVGSGALHGAALGVFALDPARARAHATALHLARHSGGTLHAAL